MSRFAQIDLSQLPPPDVIDSLDYDVVLADAMARLVALMPEVEAALALESEPLRKVLELLAYIVLLLRGRINDAAAATMLASAKGADLENLAALFGVQRLLISAATATDAAVYENDTALRARAQLAPEAYTTAGSVGAYEFHARSASPSIKDVSVTSPEPGTVLVTVLGATGNGVPSETLIGLVTAALSADEVRPLCHNVIVAAASVKHYSVAASIEVGAGPDATVVLAAARAAVLAYGADMHRLGGTVALSGLYAALHQPGVVRVTLSAPAADVATDVTAAPWCTSYNVVLGGAG